MKTVRVLHYSPHDENDGIAKYQEQYLKGMESVDGIENAFFEVSPLHYRLLNEQEKVNVLSALQSKLKDYDILHIQHEFGLFANDDFSQIFNMAKELGKKVVVSVHLSPEYAIKPVKLGGLGPRSFVSYARQKRHHDKMHTLHVEPFVNADLLFVHNTVTKDALIRQGVDEAKIVKLPHPVYEFQDPPKTTYISEHLQKKPGDVIYCNIGMLHKYKGLFDSIRALKFLPANYKLAIIGGMNPFSDEVPIYNKICDLIDVLGLHERVYITGFVVNDEVMNSYIRECDVCVYPYDGVYYGNVSSGSVNLAFANHKPVIAYPTASFKELASDADGAITLCDTYAYYELARELQRIDISKQQDLSIAYAKKMAWSKASLCLADEYKQLVR